ncbi:MAG: PLP-dependent aminotransferase family protein [Rhodospirillales bacterium]
MTPGSRLPPSRSLAVELGLSRSTVVTAYEQLAAEGYVEGRRGSGSYVIPLGNVELTAPAPAAVAPPPAPPPMRPAPLQPGAPDMRLFPHRLWARSVARVARRAPEALVSLDEPFGDSKLRQAIATHIAEWRGVSAHPRQILVTAGSGDALEICIRSLAARGQGIALEDPGYPPLRHFVTSLGLRPQWLAMGPAGAELPRSKGKPPRLAVLTPSHHFPLGGAMAPSRRQDFLLWAEANAAWIVEDDYDSEFRYAGQPIPALASGEPTDRLLYIGTFSKIFSSALRLGYLVVPEALIARFSETLNRYGTRASSAPQRALAEFMAAGDFYRHLRRVRRVYAERRRFLLEALRETLPDLPPPRDHQAGMQLVLDLPPDSDDLALSRRLAAAGVQAPALSTYSARPGGPKGLLLGFCAFEREEIAAAVETLAGVLG